MQSVEPQEDCITVSTSTVAYPPLDSQHEQPTVLQKIVNNYYVNLCWNLFKLFLGFWIYGDIVSDAMQSQKYYNNSSYWNNDHKCRNSWVVCQDQWGTNNDPSQPLDLGWVYFPLAIFSHLAPPFLLFFWSGYHQFAKWFARAECSVSSPFILVCLIIRQMLGSLFVIYIKLPSDVCRQALADLGCIPLRWAPQGSISWMKISDDIATDIRFLKLLECGGEVVLQTALASNYLVFNSVRIYHNEGKVFGLPTTVISLIFSFGSLLVSLGTGLMVLPILPRRNLYRAAGLYLILTLCIVFFYFMSELKDHLMDHFEV